MTEKNLITDSSLNDKNGSDKVSGFGLTFDDVLIEPRRSAVLPHQVSLRTKVTRKISLNIPFLSAAMDTVTESRLAIAIAREGGIGVIHKNLSIANQAAEVKKVKRSESFIIAEPVTLPYDKPLSYAIEIMLKHGISGIPIMDGDVLCGILTHRDIRFADDTTRLISSYMTKMPLITTPVGTTVEDAKAIFIKHHIEKLPVVDEKGHILGLITAKDIEKKLDFPNACMDDHGRLRVGAAVGIAANTMERVRGLVEEEIDLITVDTAHGHSEGVLKTVERIKNEFPDVQILAGNVATADGARDLVTAGADGIKIGIGAGAICTTRVIAGIGVPQITAVMSGYEALKDSGVPIVADGGIRYSGDAAKALAAGADSVMLGNLLAGVDESPGETILWEGRSYKVYYGMGSLEAMKKGSADRYFQEGAEPGKLVPEGIEGRVPYKGKLTDTIFQLCGGIRAAMGYCGCPDFESFKNETRFVKITLSGVKESHPHDVVITAEAPNYSISL